MKEHDFKDKIEYSMAENMIRDMNILKERIHGCERVEKSTVEEDKSGFDYKVFLRKGTILTVDSKTREKGSSNYWIDRIRPELALEIWSVVGDENNEAKTGWTLDESKKVDYILYTYHKDDADIALLLPFDALRNSFVRNFGNWKQEYQVKKQKSILGDKTWYSECIFVPFDIVLRDLSSFFYFDA